GVLLPERARPALGAGKRGAGVDGTDDSARDSAGVSRVRLPARGRPLQTPLDVGATEDQRDRDLPLGVEKALVARARCGLGVAAGSTARRLSPRPCVRVASSLICKSIWPGAESNC